MPAPIYFKCLPSFPSGSLWNESNTSLSIYFMWPSIKVLLEKAEVQHSRKTYFLMFPHSIDHLADRHYFTEVRFFKGKTINYNTLIEVFFKKVTWKAGGHKCISSKTSTGIHSLAMIGQTSIHHTGMHLSSKHVCVWRVASNHIRFLREDMFRGSWP